MPNLLQTLRDTYTENPAKVLNMLPKLFKQYDEGLIKVLPCRIGTKLWHIYDKDKGPQECYTSDDNIFLIAKRINQTVFLTRAEAEKALEDDTP